MSNLQCHLSRRALLAMLPLALFSGDALARRRGGRGGRWRTVRYSHAGAAILAVMVAAIGAGGAWLNRVKRRSGPPISSKRRFKRSNFRRRDGRDFS